MHCISFSFLFVVTPHAVGGASSQLEECVNAIIEECVQDALEDMRSVLTECSESIKRKTRETKDALHKVSQNMKKLQDAAGAGSATQVRAQLHNTARRLSKNIEAATQATMQLPGRVGE